LFALVGITWIVASDALLDLLVSERVEGWVQTVKGVLFILAASGVVFVLMRRLGRHWERAENRARETADALGRSELKHRSLLERVPGVVWLNEVNREDPTRTRCIYISPQLEEFLGYTPEAWMADEDLWKRVIHPDDRPAVLILNHLADESHALSLEYRAFRTDGSIVWIHDEAVMIPSDGDEPAYWQGVMVDITAQRAQDLALQELSESLRGVFQASPLAIIVLEPDGRVRHWNPAAERIFGWTAAEVIGRLVPYVPEDRAEEFERFRQDTIAGSSVAGLETVRIRKDGTAVDVSLSIAPLVGPGGAVTGMLGVLDDITERRRVAAELASRQRQQEAVAGLAVAALEGGELQDLLQQAAELVAATLEIPISAVLELLPDERTLLLRSGVGWRTGRVGSHALSRDDPSLAGLALESSEPVIVDDLPTDTRFPGAQDLVAHGVVSGVATTVSGGRRPYGVLEALATNPRAFDREDVRFLQGIAVIIALAIEQHRGALAVRAAEEKYRSLVEDGPATVYLHGADRVPAEITYVSPQIVDLLGYPHDTWTVDPSFWLEAVHRADRERLSRARRAAVERRHALDIEYRMTAEDGREVWVQDRAALVRGADGEPLFYQGVLVDVTDRHRAEDERRTALDRQLRLATRLELLHLIDREVLSSTSIDEMAGRTLDHLRLLVPYDRGVVALVDPETDRFSYASVRADGGMTVEPDLEMVPPDGQVRELLLGDVIVDPDEMDVRNPHTKALLAAGVHSVLSIALGADDGQLGALILESRLPNAFGEEAMDIAKEVGSELAIAIGQTRLRQALADRAQELEQLADERQQMLHRIVRAQEEERERVALELHDGLGQILTSISLFASDLAEEVGEKARPRAVRVNELIRRAIVDSRQLVWSLRPPELERLGLVPALRRLADDTSVPELPIDLHEEIGDVRLTAEAEAVVYRVVQEAVHNAQKHAHASAISILLQRHNGHLTSLVEDNGRGFDPTSIPAGRGLGLIGMRERAELVEGALVVESAIDAGTRVRLMVPIGATVIETNRVETNGVEADGGGGV
jgi:PAS domain S-box-containing protein